MYQITSKNHISPMKDFSDICTFDQRLYGVWPQCCGPYVNAGIWELQRHPRKTKCLHTCGSITQIFFRCTVVITYSRVVDAVAEEFVWKCWLFWFWIFAVLSRTGSNVLKTIISLKKKTNDKLIKKNSLF